MQQAGMAPTVFTLLGISVIGYSLVTRYSRSIAKLLPLKTHMFFDVVIGVVLMLSPMGFGYNSLLTGGQLVLHFVLGLGAIALVSLTSGQDTKTKFQSSSERERHKHAA
jgi:hypothetical protein